MNHIVERDIDAVVRRLNWETLGSMDVLVSGATGILGSYLYAIFRRGQTLGYHHGVVWGLSKRGGTPLGLKENSRAPVVACDVSTLAGPLLANKFDLVIHAAGYGQPSKFTTTPLDTVRVNTSGTLNMLAQVTDGGRFAYLSSSEVYSGLPHGLALESEIGTTTPEHVRGAYIESKRCGEAIVHAARVEKNLQAVAFRLALAYGPGARRDDGRVLNQIILSALVNRRIELRDSGSAVRTYCYVSDAAEMLLRVITRDYSGVVNLGGESTTTIRGLAESVSRITGATLVIPDQGSQALAGAPESVQLDLSRLRALSDMGALVSLDDGLERTIAWQRHQLG